MWDFIMGPFAWITGGLSVTALVLLALFAPSVLKVVAEVAVKFLGPLAEWTVAKLTAFFDVLIEGAKDMLDNWKSIVFVATLVATASWYFHKSDQTCIEQVRKEWRLLPREAPKAVAPIKKNVTVKSTKKAADDGFDFTKLLPF